jgi:hypothetical protein
VAIRDCQPETVDSPLPKELAQRQDGVQDGRPDQNLNPEGKPRRGRWRRAIKNFEVKKIIGLATTPASKMTTAPTPAVRSLDNRATLFISSVG